MLLEDGHVDPRSLRSRRERVEEIGRQDDPAQRRDTELRNSVVAGRHAAANSEERRVDELQHLREERDITFDDLA